MKRRRTITLKITRRADGMWCKKINGKLKYFGYVGCDESVARRDLLEYVRLQDAGESPVRGATVRVFDVADRYAIICEARVANGEGLQGRTWKTYDNAIKEFVDLIGSGLIVRELGADDFAKVARKWRSLRGAHRVNNDIQAIRTMFRWAYENGLLERTPIYGKEFSKSPNAHTRMEGIARREGHGERKFAVDELQKILSAVKGQMRAMVLLALNAGLYSIDVADLKWSDLRKDGKLSYIDTTRHKTGIPRRFVLWPETIRAVNSMERIGELIFLTSHGNPWNNRNHTDSIALMFRRLLKRLDIKRPGVNFGAFRHTHVSAVGDHTDQAAARFVRGHLIEGITRHYDFPSLERIKSVTDHARRRLIRTALEPAATRVRSSLRSPKSRRRDGASAV